MVNFLGILFVSCSDQEHREMFHCKSSTCISEVLDITVWYIVKESSGLSQTQFFWLVVLIDMCIQKFIIISIAS